MANVLIWEGSPRDVEPGDYDDTTPHRVTADDSGSFTVEVKGEDKMGAVCWSLLGNENIRARVVTRAAVKVLVDQWVKSRPKRS